MKVTLFQAILIGLVYYVGNSWLWGVTFQTVYRPLVNGFIVGLILGDPVKGTIIGATINLIYLGFISAGGTVPGDPCLAGVVTTAIAIASNLDAEAALALAVPIGLVGTLIWVFRMSVTTIFVHRADVYAERGNLKGVAFNNVILPQAFLIIISAVPVALAVLYGPDFVQSALSFLGDKVVHLLTVIGGMMPALGIALNMKTIMEKSTIVYYFLGFLLSTYLNLDIIGIGLFAAVIAYVSSQNIKGGQTYGKA